MVLERGTLETIVSLLGVERPLSAVRNLVWCLSNLCRNKNPPPSFTIVRKALPILRRLLTFSDADILGKWSVGCGDWRDPCPPSGTWPGASINIKVLILGAKLGPTLNPLYNRGRVKKFPKQHGTLGKLVPE